METLWLLQLADVNARKGPLGGELADIPTELLNLSVTLLALRLCGSHTNKVLKHLGPGFLLQKKGKLDSPMQEVGDLLNVLLKHITRGQSRSTKTDAARDLCRSVTGNSVFCGIQ
jgi:hypothetical protein